MTLPVVVNPFDAYVSLAGAGLNGGSLYIGVAGQDPQSNPQACYWDAAGTIPAAQPIAVLGGYPMRLGSPAQIYTAPTYSMRLRDAQGVQVFYVATISATTAANLTYTPQGGSPVTRPVSAKLDDFVSTEDNGSIAEALTQAHAAGVPMIWPNGTHVVTSNLPFLYQVKHLGDGAISDGASSIFTPGCPAESTNNFYVSATGSDSNDGISAARPILTPNEPHRRITHMQDSGDCFCQINFPAGIITLTESMVIRLKSKKVRLQGKFDRATASSVGAITGAAGNWSVPYTLVAGHNAAVGHSLIIRNATGTGRFEVLNGNWRITAVAGNVVTVRHTGQFAAFPTATLTGGDIVCIHTVLSSPGITALRAYSEVDIGGICFRGDGSAGTQGIMSCPEDVPFSAAATVRCDDTVAVESYEVGFWVACNGSIHAPSLAVSDCVVYGTLSQHGGSLFCSGAVANGNRAVGFASSNGGDYWAEGSFACGNGTYGCYSFEGGSGLVKAGTFNCNLQNGVFAEFGGDIRGGGGSTASFNAVNGISAQRGGSEIYWGVVGDACTAKGNAVDNVLCDYDGVITCEGADLSTPGTNNIAAGHAGKVFAAHATPSLIYFAGQGCFVDLTGSAITSGTPAVNAIGAGANLGAIVVN